MTDPLERSRAPGGPHQRLCALVGEWHGTTRTWLEPGQPAEECPQEGTIRPILNGRFVVHEYRSRLGGESVSGMALIGFHLGRQRFEVAWVDTFHMGSGIMFSEGESTAHGLSVRGRYGDPAGGPPWGWRTEIQLLDEENLMIAAYNIAPDGQETLAVETIYRRVR